jgi:type IV pilus assembly protein PilV
MGMQKQLGASLMEVMVSLFVMAIGLLGILGLQFKSIQYNQSASSYSQAIYLANDLVERIRANPNPGANYAQAIPTSVPSTNCASVPCGSDALALYDLYHWSEAVKRSLPAGATASVEKLDIKAPYTIVIKFDDGRADKVSSVNDSGEYQKKEYRIVARN